MPQYIFAYLGGEYPSNPEEGKKHFEKYQQWLMSLGNAVVSPAVPFKDTHTVQADGTVSPGSTSAISGLSIIRMGSMEEALAAAQSCPFLEINGVLEVSEMIEMTGGHHERRSDKLNQAPNSHIRLPLVMSNLPGGINTSRITESIDSLKQHFREDDIASLISVLEDIVKSPQDSALVAQLYDVFNGLDITQGAILTYAPYLAVVLSGEPFKNPD